MPKVSIIMPSLNVAGYIRQCMESVIKQTLTDIEILCIDAGSTDGTYEILKEYASADSRIRLLQSHKKSYGYQVNLGIDMAVGEYLGIVETDDYIEPDMYEVLYNTAVKHDLDFAKAGFDVFITPAKEEHYQLSYPMPDCNQILSSEYFTGKQLSNDIYIWNGIYRLSFLREFKIRLNESPGAAFQDCGFRYLVDTNLRRGMFLNQSFYRYRRDNSSSSTYNPRCVRYNLAECGYIRRRMREENVEDIKKRSFIARETVMMALEPYITLRGVSEPDSETREALEEFREIIKEDRENGLLRQEEMLPKHWIEMRLFTEAPKAWEAYVAISSEAGYALFRDFIKKMSDQKQIVIFSAGKAASYALCLMRMNEIDTIQAFCDNDKKKWGGRYGKYHILAPGEAVKRYPKAHYLIANRVHGEEIKEQLCAEGIPEADISVYKLPLSPMESTNYFMKLCK